MRVKGEGKRSHKGCNPDIPVLDLTIVTVKLKFTVSHISGFIMLTKSAKLVYNYRKSPANARLISRR